MGRAIPVDLGIKRFSKKKDAKDYFSEMIDRYRKNQDVIGEDAEILYRLIERHPGRDQKVGVGIAGFYRGEPPDAGHRFNSQKDRCFWIRRTDGSETDFSFHTCIDAVPPPKKRLVMDAMRVYVYPEIEEAKRELFEKLQNEDQQIQCPVTGQWITFWETHADHRSPRTFEEIAATFLDLKELTWDTVPLTESRDSQSVPEFTDQQLVLDWQKHHHRMASGHIRLISKQKNLQESNRHRLRMNKKEQQFSLVLKR